MRYWFHLATILALSLCGSSALAAPGAELEWSELPDPSVQVFEDPYRDLSPEQFDDLIFVVRLRGRLRQEVGSPDERRKWQELLVETEEALAADGIDIDWLLDQRLVVAQRRDRAGAAGNPEFDGQTVTLAGFAIPAPPDADGHPIAYLVPQPGMCSHLPPPPPNQMIRVRLNGDWEPGYVHELVRLTGKLTIDPSEQNTMVVDGLMPMRATFQLEADSVETLETQGGGLKWTQSSAERFRAAGNSKTGAEKASE